jgi:hypothetical protein
VAVEPSPAKVGVATAVGAEGPDADAGLKPVTGGDFDVFGVNQFDGPAFAGLPRRGHRPNALTTPDFIPLRKGSCS